MGCSALSGRHDRVVAGYCAAVQFVFFCCATTAASAAWHKKFQPAFCAFHSISNDWDFQSLEYE